MFSGIIANIANERAALARDMEYIRENAKDEIPMESIVFYDGTNGGTTAFTESCVTSREEDAMINEAISQMSPEDDDAPVEIERIVSSPNKNVDLDEMMGISTPEEPNETEYVYNLMTNECGSDCRTESGACYDDVVKDSDN